MSKTQMLERLFSAHSTDLLDVVADLDADLVPQVMNRVLCPICLVGYSKEAVFDKRLTDGHVWPEDIRQSSRQARQHRVLLCDGCNHTSGSRGDVQMQIFECVREEESSGHYRERQVKFVFSGEPQLVSLNASLFITTSDIESTEATVYFEPSRNDPKELSRFRDLSRQAESFSVIVPSHKLVKPRVAKVGWLTAAYLMAFRAFGYRYILHPGLNPVRQCIKDSFRNDEPELAETEVLQIRHCDEHDNRDPSLSVIIPSAVNQSVYLQVDFLSYHVRLPFHFHPDILKVFVRRRIPDGFTMPINGTLGLRVECTKIQPHDCEWDYVLGKPLPNV